MGRTFAQGVSFASPVFDGALEADIKHQLRASGLPESGKIRLRDGRTGDPFEQLVTVGYIYLMKLSHLVDDKIHRPVHRAVLADHAAALGGKAQFGGQRFGEMEVWRSRPTARRTSSRNCSRSSRTTCTAATKIYEALVKGEPTVEPGLARVVQRAPCASCRACAWTSNS